MNELNPYSVESSELVEQTFRFWFSDNDHIRSPFPTYIHNQLKVLATDKFYDWANGLNLEAKDEISDEIIAEKFENIIFETAMNLVMTEDEKITIKYPFLPRIEDIIYENAEKREGESIVVDRDIEKEGDSKFMKLKLSKTENGEVWETKFELPE